MIVYRAYRFGGIYGMRYHFGRAGDALPVHSHARDTHNLICLQGAVWLRLGARRLRVNAGEIHEFDGLIEHTVEALEPAETLHLYEHGRPADFQDDFIGTIGKD